MAGRAVGCLPLPPQWALCMMLDQSSVSVSLSGALRSVKAIPCVSFRYVSATGCVAQESLSVE